MNSFTRALAAGLIAALLAGCAAPQTSALLAAPHADVAPRAELTATPFFAQERYQCGPAALAMALGAAGFHVSPDALVSQVYLPQREGSLQVEMLASARRNGAFGVTIAPRMDALLAEVAGGHPVVVLQNLSLPVFPRWHYAVVIGYDLAARDIILRSGLTQRMVMPMSTFEHTWARSGYWGMVALAPGQLPVTTDEAAVLDALVAFEKTGRPGEVRKTYAAAAMRWPANTALLIGLGNTAYQAGDREAAAAAFRNATEGDPRNAPALNNLAVVLTELGQLKEARKAAEQAIALGGQWRQQALDTLATIEKAERR